MNIRSMKDKLKYLIPIVITVVLFLAGPDYYEFRRDDPNKRYEGLQEEKEALEEENKALKEFIKDPNVVAISVYFRHVQEKVYFKTKNNFIYSL